MKCWCTVPEMVIEEFPVRMEGEQVMEHGWMV